MSNEKFARAVTSHANGPAYSQPPYMLTRDDVLRQLSTDGDRGLPIHVAQQRLVQYGRNELDGAGGVQAWKVSGHSRTTCHRSRVFAGSVETGR